MGEMEESSFLAWLFSFYSLSLCMAYKLNKMCVQQKQSVEGERWRQKECITGWHNKIIHYFILSLSGSRLYTSNEVR